MTKFITFIFIALITCGCSTAPIYHGPTDTAPGATLRFEPLEGITKFEGNTAVDLAEINGQNLSYWRMSDKCRLSPGNNEIVVKGISPDMRTKAYARLTFFVKDGETYTVKRGSWHRRYETLR